MRLIPVPNANVPLPVPVIVNVTTPTVCAVPASVALEVVAIASVALSLSLIVVTFAVLPNDFVTDEPPRFPSDRLIVSLPSSSTSSVTVNVVFLVVPVTAPESNVTVCVPNAV